jgi:hypothetical protein
MLKKHANFIDIETYTLNFKRSAKINLRKPFKKLKMAKLYQSIEKDLFSELFRAISQ